MVKFKVLPDCDICKMQTPNMVQVATGDSATTLGPWGYTCDSHKGFRVGPVTVLELDEE